MRIGNHTGGAHAGSHADHIGFRNAAVNRAARIFCHQFAGADTVHQVGVEIADTGICVHLRLKRSGDDIAHAALIFYKFR